MFGVRNEERGGRHPQNVKPLVSDFWSSPPTLHWSLTRAHAFCTISLLHLPNFSPSRALRPPSLEPTALFIPACPQS